MRNGPLKLDDADFWTNPAKTADEVSAALRRAEYLGVLFDAPSFVPIEARESLPVAGYHAATLRDSNTLSFEDVAVVTASRLEDGSVFAAKAIEAPNAPSPLATEEDDDELHEEGSVLSPFQFDLRRRLNLPWEPASYLVTILLRDSVSNRVGVKLGPLPRTYKDPEVEKWVESRKGPRYPPPVWPPAGDPLPRYRPTPASPRVPAEPGLVLQVARVVEQPGPIVVQGSFRLPVELKNLVRPPAAGHAAYAPDVGDPHATAVFPVTLLFTGAESALPEMIRLNVPSYDPLVPDTEPQLATGHFAVDVGALRGAPRTLQTYFLYAFAGALMAGPELTAFVAEEMLPP